METSQYWGFQDCGGLLRRAMHKELHTQEREGWGAVCDTGHRDGEVGEATPSPLKPSQFFHQLQMSDMKL